MFCTAGKSSAELSLLENHELHWELASMNSLAAVADGVLLEL